VTADAILFRYVFECVLNQPRLAALEAATGISARGTTDPDRQLCGSVAVVVGGAPVVVSLERFERRWAIVAVCHERDRLDPDSLRELEAQVADLVRRLPDVH